MEKQEAKSLRQALEDMDLKEQQRVHSAAQDEAAELVWKHRNPKAAHAPKVFANPDLKNYRSHLRKGSYARSHSQDNGSGGQRSASEGSHSSNSDHSPTSESKYIQERPRKVSPPTGVVSVPKRRVSSGKNYDQLKEAVAKDIAVAHRRSSSGSRRAFSSEKKLFMHPNDKIWEDVEEEKSPPKKQLGPVLERGDVEPAAQPPVPSYVRKNPFARVRAQYDRMERSNSAPVIHSVSAEPERKSNPVEIQKNPPSQTRNPWYRSNEPLPPTPPSTSGRDADDVAPKTTPTKAGKEIRGDDIRAATSKTRKEYSPNLPRPTMVSERPGRPIVSFQKDYRPQEIVMEEKRSPAPPPKFVPGPSKTTSRMPASTQSAPSVPQISINDGSQPPMPMINLPDEPCVPSIVLPEEPSEHLSNGKGLPTINIDSPRGDAGTPSISVSGPHSNPPSCGEIPRRPSPSGRPMPRHAATAPLAPTKSTPHYTPSIRQSGTLCAHCALPIAGRILSAAGERFHPGCFVCHQCNTNLELVAFYPEPEKTRAERLERIHARQSGVEVEFPEGMTEYEQEVEDGDETLRFYCHLDFHELFSPRCKSCKTPIEGEVVVACGAEWHVGHFFCAQCGDPFDSTMPFVEKDGYAWCVGCHTNRYSPKCRKCRKPVTDVVVKALGSDWHGDCFVCTASGVVIIVGVVDGC